MMKQFICIVCALCLGATVMSAQEERQTPPSHAKRVYIALQGGPALNIYENAFSYEDNGRAMDLFTFQGALAVGYDFSEVFGLRLQGAFGKDAGACNVRETAGGGFYPYSFRHVNLFADAVLNLAGFGGRSTAFRPKLYAGLGAAHTFGFTDAKHPWQKVVGRNTVFGARGGFIAEYTFNSGIGLYADLCGEAYNDMYNGLMPSEEDQKRYEGYAGFPLDLRGIVSLGVVYHF